MNIRQVSEIAFKDISKYLKEKYAEKGTHYMHEWVITPTMLNTKETRRLNKELGLDIINKKKT